MSQTRRLAAIVMADVVGYSRLVGADEEGTLAALTVLRRGKDVFAPVGARRATRPVVDIGGGGDRDVLRVGLRHAQYRVRRMPALTVGDERLNRPFARAGDREHFLSGFTQRGSARGVILVANRRVSTD